MKTLNNFTTTLPVVTGEFSTRTSYLSWEGEKGQPENWAQGEFYIAIYNDVTSVIHTVADENGDDIYIVIAPIK